MEDAEINRLLGGRPRVVLDDIVKHPRLPAARKVYLDHFLQVYGNDPFLVRLLIESGRILVYLISAVLEASHDPARRETWFTVGLLKQTIAQFGLASGRHVDQLVARLCAVGYMEARAAEEDRRVRILSPTEKMRSHDRDWLVAHYAPLTVLYPQHDYGLIMQRDPEFQAVYRLTSVAFLPLAAKLMRTAPDMMLFLDRAGGYMIIAAILQIAMEQGDHSHVAVPYDELGERFGVSRTHVRKLLVAAEEASLVRIHARGGRVVEILPRLWSSHDRGIANGMYLHDMAYLAAARRCGAGLSAEEGKKEIENA